MFPGNRRPVSGTGRDLVVCDGCGRKQMFYYRVGDLSLKEIPCPACSHSVALQGFLSWAGDGPLPEPDRLDPS